MRLWSTFGGKPKATNLHTSITALSSVGSLLVATCSSSLVIFSSDGPHVRQKRSIARFSGRAYSGDLRRDARLVVSGCDDGSIKVFDVKSKALMRHFKSPTKTSLSTRLTQWSRADKTRLYAASDDGSCSVYDLASESRVSSWQTHKDFVRCGAQSDLGFVTGSYDHTVKVWDDRVSTSEVKSFTHGCPVESVTCVTSSLVASGGSDGVVKVWDVNTGKVVQTLRNHAKTVTCLSTCEFATSKFLVSGGLDGMVRAYDCVDFETCAAFKASSPVLSLAMSSKSSETSTFASSSSDEDSSDDSESDDVVVRRRDRLLIGLASGELLVRTKNYGTTKSVTKRMNADDEAPEVSAIDSLFRTTTKTDPQVRMSNRKRHFQRGQDELPTPHVDIVVPKPTKKKRTREKPYDRLVRKFEYSSALNAALDTKQPAVVVNVLRELQKRGNDAVKSALKNRTDASLENLMSFLIKYVASPKYALVLVDVCGSVVELYESSLGLNMVVDELFVRLQKALAEELALQEALLRVRGTLDLVLSSRA